MAEMKKEGSYTEEELSRILSEHAAGQLVAYGTGYWARSAIKSAYPRGCVNQVAYNEPFCSIAYGLNAVAAAWFDCYYYADMKAETLLRGLETDATR